MLKKFIDLNFRSKALKISRAFSGFFFKNRHSGYSFHKKSETQLKIRGMGTAFFCLCLLTGCEKYYLSLRQVPVDVTYLASSGVGTPDPRQANPPYGQKVVMEWAIPPELLEQKPEIVFHVIYKNYTQEELIYPIEDRSGMEVFSLLNENYEAKGGILTYHAIIRTQQGKIYREWKHQLWVHLITLDDETDSAAARTSSSVSVQPKQGSVTEIP